MEGTAKEEELIVEDVIRDVLVNKKGRHSVSPAREGFFWKSKEKL